MATKRTTNATEKEKQEGYEEDALRRIIECHHTNHSGTESDLRRTILGFMHTSGLLNHEEYKFHLEDAGIRRRADIQTAHCLLRVRKTSLNRDRTIDFRVLAELAEQLERVAASGRGEPNAILTDGCTWYWDGNGARGQAQNPANTTIFSDAAAAPKLKQYLQQALTAPKTETTPSN